MDSWEKFDEILLPKKSFFYSNLNKEGITNIDYKGEKKNVEKL